MANTTNTTAAHHWQLSELQQLYHQPFNDLLYKAHQIHRQNFDHNAVQISTLLSIKTGSCPEDCAYCPQSGHYNTNIDKEKLMATEKVVEFANQAKNQGATRFCMGAAWKSPPDKQFPQVLAMVKQVKQLGLETCLTAGMLTEQQAQALQQAGLDYYNHNLDSSPEYYAKIITTRTYQDRLQTLQHVRENGINTCCGGIIGMGETLDDRLKLLQQLAKLPVQPQSVPINMLVPITGTPLGEQPPLDPFDFVRIIALARIILPKSYLRISAGRNNMNDQCQALCFFAGANSIFYGEKLLTTPLPSQNKDMQLLDRLNLHAEHIEQPTEAAIANG